MRIEIHRAKESWNYKRNPAKAAWDNNDANNSLDLFMLFDDEDELVFHCHCQTVSNCEGIVAGSRHTDTLAAGRFAVKLFVDPRNFRGRIHGVILAQTIAGEGIREDSTTKSNASRWLVHDWQKHRDQTPGDTRVAWSAGCIVMPTKALAEFNSIIDLYQLPPGFIIPGEITEELR